MQSPKRRKVRKGTQSCWECKRRKIKCIFATAEDAVCSGCAGRKTKCLSQEFERVMVKPTVMGREDAAPLGNRNWLAYAEDLPPGLRRQGGAEVRSDSMGGGFGCDEYTGLMEAVRLYWPSEHDIKILQGQQISTAILTHGTICLPYAKLFSRPLQDLGEVLRPIDPNSEPIYIARRCLMLATCLQGLSTSSTQKFSALGVDHRTIRDKLFDAATAFVRNKADLLLSVEGIECLMMESMYHNNAGNLKRAWLVNRKAIAQTQMIGMHLGKKGREMVLDVKTWVRVEPRYMWRRLVASDRYLSSMIGLPQAVGDDLMEDLTADIEESEWDRMELMELQAGGLILKMASSQRRIEEAMLVDDMLQEAAACMSASWWSEGMNVEALAKNSADGLKETLRIMAHFTHYHLLIRLHLPPLLREATSGSGHDYSNLVVANAGRSVLDLYVAFRSADLAPAYCRGVDFIVFIAAVALCLVHLEVRRLTTDSRSAVTALDALRHQERSDRGKLNKVLRIMQDMSAACTDPTTSRIASILVALFDLMDSCGQSTLIPSVGNEEVQGEDTTEVNGSRDADGGLKIHLPHFGVLKIGMKANTSKPAADDPTKNMPDSNETVESKDAPWMGDDLGGRWALDGVDFALFDDIGVDWTFDDFVVSTC